MLVPTTPTQTFTPTFTFSPTATPTNTPTPTPTPVQGLQNASYTYDGDGKLVKEVEDGVTTLYVGAHYQVSGEVVTKYYFAGTQRIAMRTNGVLNYLLADHLGSTSLVTDAAGTVIAEVRYTPYGETRFSAGTSPTDYLYTSQRQEAGLGLYFYNARWYDPALGRFTQADTIVPGAGNPQAFDRYAYVLGNPMRYTDPSGHGSECLASANRQACEAQYNNVSPVVPTQTPTPTSTPTYTPTYTPTFTPTMTPPPSSTPCNNPSNYCATVIAAQATQADLNCHNGTGCWSAVEPTSTPTITPQPIDIMSPDTAQLIKEIAKPQIIQQPSKIIPPIYPDLGNLVNAGYEWIRVYGGWGITNKFRPGDYYNGQRALEILLSAAATGAKYAAPYVVQTANVLSRITYPAPIFPNPNLILPLINPAPIRN